ncbi:urea ABC transporter ATP-binding subunit UrtE [Pseudanabaena sp. PCC 6802]|uniref:urea ABC transporter ATP-binding subunit UrtE n=1 Tax=Pseudanabaena sp. PCC 6802 TaxID=118173 RepID=UPI000377BCE3|nr:urea ABC transporter ATP-binding subunit UrtE [Pseudanabaena sp. PCC 6802]
MTKDLNSALLDKPEVTHPILNISGLNVYYGESHILRNVDLNVFSGEMVCLIGRNGVGKTTLLKTIIGLLSARSGEVNLMTESILRRSPDRRAKLGIGYVPQGREIIPKLTVKENLLLGLETGRTKGRETEMMEQAFELFPVLKSMLWRLGGNLSGGQQQQLAIARALMGRPQLLLLDEPTEGIQPSIVLEIEASIQRIVKTTGISVLLVEQHLHFVRQANRYYAMQKGTIVASGETKSLSNDIIQQFLAV